MKSRGNMKKSGKNRARLKAGAALLSWLLMCSHLAATRAGVELVVPPEPPVKPIIVPFGEMDHNGNLIDDLIDQQLAEAEAVLNRIPPASPEEIATAEQALAKRLIIIFSFSRRITLDELESFVRLGGEVTWIYKRVAYGWNGEIALGQIPRAVAAMGPGLVGVEASRVYWVEPNPASPGIQIAFPLSISVLTSPNAGAVPLLRMERTGAQVLLCWPHGLTNAVLESAADLAPGSPWSKVSDSPTVKGDQNELVLELARPSQFYRLRW